MRHRVGRRSIEARRLSLGAWIERRTVALVLAVSAAAWAFAGLAEMMDDGRSHAFDSALLLAMRETGDPSDPLGPPWFEEMARDFTSLGGIGVLVLVTLAVAGVLGLSGKRRSMAFLLVATVSGQALSSLAKFTFDRPRPDLVPHEAVVYTTSFPSGHSMMAAVTYLTLAALLARSQPRRRVKLFLLGVAILVTLLVGTSRVYLGVHWPTDVLAGWTAGAAWALLCLLVARMLRRRGMIEPSG